MAVATGNGVRIPLTLDPNRSAAAVNVNTAQQSELLRVKGLDRHKAKAIIDYRNENGRIDSLAELALVPGITPAVISKAESDIAFTGDPYVPKPKAKPARKKGR